MVETSNLSIPTSHKTVSVRIIDSTTHITNLPLTKFLQPEIPGYTKLDCPAFSFLIEHPSGQKLLFDLGVRKDHENLAPAIVDRIKKGGWTVKVKQNVREQLEEHGVDGKEINAVILSHHHWDHLGDPSTFDASTALLVGPGFKSKLVPAYPEKKDSPIQTSDFEGREFREIDFNSTGGLKIGRFEAFDFFEDGSFYLLSSPGHAVGHMCGLARVTSSPDSFIFMGGDVAHHGGEIRPSKYLPFPESITPHPFGKSLQSPCPGALFEHLLRDGDHDKPFYTLARPSDGSGISDDPDEAERSVEKTQEADARDDILVVLAHDSSLLDVCEFFPKYANDFAKKGWVKEGRWGFLKDFQPAVDSSGGNPN